MKRYAVSIVLALLAAQTAAAGIADLGTTVPGFTGTREFRASWLANDGVTSVHLDVDVDFAVFEPGTLDPGLVISDLTGGDPLQTNEFVYAYHLTNLQSSTVALSRLGLSLTDGANVTGLGTAAGDLSSPRNASLGILIPDTALTFLFFPEPAGNGQLDVSEESFYLFYSSPNGPQFDAASIVDGGVSNTVLGGLPTPTPVIPSPTAAVLGLLGTGIALALRRRR